MHDARQSTDDDEVDTALGKHPNDGLEVGHRVPR